MYDPTELLKTSCGSKPQSVAHKDMTESYPWSYPPSRHQKHPPPRVIVSLGPPIAFMLSVAAMLLPLEGAGGEGELEVAPVLSVLRLRAFKRLLRKLWGSCPYRVEFELCG